MLPSQSTTPPPPESGYILILCMIFVILISLAFASIMQTLDHYQRLSTEFKMNRTVLTQESALMLEAKQEAGQKNQQLQNSTPQPSESPDLQNKQNQINLRAIILDHGNTLNIWQGWFFIHDPNLPNTPLFEAIIRCNTGSAHCEIIHWHRA
jgi:hypothetical protein